MQNSGVLAKSRLWSVTGSVWPFAAMRARTSLCFCLRTHLDSMIFACCSGVIALLPISVKTDWSVVVLLSSCLVLPVVDPGLLYHV